MDYSQLSDFEINKRVAQVHGGFALTLAVHDEPPSEKAFNPVRFDPCNNPADAWPIISENEISIIFNWNEDGLHGATNCPWISSENPNPLRAAMECFLLMQEQGNA